MPGMYAVTSIPLVSRTRATLRNAEFGFLGVVVNTRVHTPRRWGEPFRAGVLVLSALDSRPLRTSWAIVGTRDPLQEIAGEGAERAPGAKTRQSQRESITKGRSDGKPDRSS